MANQYYIGIPGLSGVRCIGVAYLVDPLPEGQFTSLRAARRAAAELAVMWANELYSESCRVDLVIVRENPGGFGEVVALATGKRGRRRASWV